MFRIQPKVSSHNFYAGTSNVSREQASFANPTLDGISPLLGTPAGATVGWIHFLAFDLFVGRWAYLDSRTRGLSPWAVSPALFLILMSGPLGLLLYLGVRALARLQPVAANA